MTLNLAEPAADVAEIARQVVDRLDSDYRKWQASPTAFYGPQRITIIASALQAERDRPSAALEEIKRLREALRAVLADFADYERANNLFPNPGKKDCWQSVTAARSLLGEGK